MARQFQPGELIRAEDFNDVFSTLEALQNRITALESTTGGIVISSVSPVGQQNIGQLVEIFGANLPSPGESTVLFGSTQAVVFGSSISTVMRVEVPFVAGAPRDVDITITSGGNVARWPAYRVLAEVANAPNPTAITDPNGIPILRQSRGFILTGTNLSPNPIVTFDTVAGGSPTAVANPVVNGAGTQITGTVPNLGVVGSGLFRVHVQVGNNSGEIPGNVTVTS